MALGATIYTFEIALADADRGVYEQLALRAARHPSETSEYLVVRVLAYCVEYAEGIGFSKGLSAPDEPAIFVRDLTGAYRAWIEVGQPDAARVHKAAKAAPRVVVYTHRDLATLKRLLGGERIHRADEIDLCAFDRDLVNAFVARLDRRMKLDLAVSGGYLYVTIGGETLSGPLERIRLDDAN